MKKLLTIMGVAVLSLSLIVGAAFYPYIRRQVKSQFAQYIEKKVEIEVQEQLKRNYPKKSVQKTSHQLIQNTLPTVVGVVGEYTIPEFDIIIIDIPGPIDPEEDIEEDEEEDYDFYPDYNLTGRRSGGSGFFINSKGHILTCAHLFPHDYKESLERLTVFVYDGSKKGIPIEAEILGLDREADLALLKLVNYKKSTKYLYFKSSKYINMGDEILVFGHPFLKFTWTVTSGIVSGLNRTMKIGVHEHNGMIQSDAIISPGNSGGPMIDMSGKVIGVTSSYHSLHSFMVSSETCLKFIEKYSVK